ncbi:MAG TPA: hypothetical protein VJ816_08230 [Gemmatimonadales bacterium]|nr:hypothetical protein [Gemmatimonadales bacterium]
MGGKGSGRRDKYKRRKVEGLLGPVLETDIPTRVLGVAQMAEDMIPSACPRCHCSPPESAMWSRTEWVGHCSCCGTTIVRTIGSVAFKAHRQRPPVYYAGHA